MRAIVTAPLRPPAVSSAAEPGIEPGVGIGGVNIEMTDAEVEAAAGEAAGGVDNPQYHDNGLLVF